MRAIALHSTHSFNASNHPSVEGLELPAGQPVTVTQEQADYLRQVPGIEVQEDSPNPKPPRKEK